jgi:hypothetical protein
MAGLSAIKVKTKMRLFAKHAGIFAASVMLFGLSSASVLASGDDAGSLENIWADQSQRGTSSVREPAAPQASTRAAAAPAAQAPVVSTIASPPPAASGAAPMCSLEDLQKSTLAQRGGWPGLGPFKAGDGGANDLVDPAGNHLRLSVDADKVTVAELAIARRKPALKDFLDLEMAADFLLEAVGTKSQKIATLNAALEKDKQAVLFKSDASPLSYAAGHYLVFIQRQKEQGGELYNYSIRVNSRDASRDAIKQHEVSGSAPLPGSQDTEAPSTPPAAAEAAATAGDGLKEQFVAVIKNWQKVKKSAVRSRQATELAEALRGKALQRQSDAIKWLVTNHKYYDMTPLSVTVSRYSELAPGSKFSVIAQVKESSKLIDEASSKVIKESSDTYNVNYTVEKIDDRWLITDSAIVTNGQPAAATRPPAVKAGR